MSNPLSIGIAGAGLSGRLLAWQLAKLGHRITLFDKDQREAGDAAGFTAAGMLTPYAEAEAAELPIYRLGLRSLELWPSLVQELGSVRYQSRGSLLLAHAADYAELAQFNAQLKHSIEPSANQQQHLDRRGLHQLEPELCEHFDKAEFFPEEAWISASDCMQALARQCLELGVQWLEHTQVEEIGEAFICARQRHQAHAKQQPEQAPQQHGEALRRDFDWVIDCRGTGAKSEWKDVRAVRGELLWVQAPAVNITRLVRLMHPRYRLYLVPTGKDDIYIIGATQIESEDWSPMSVRSALELLSALYSLHSGFAEARIVKMDSNCRPALKNNLPQIQVHNRVLRINGLFRHGYLLAPAVAEQVLAVIQKQKVCNTHSAIDSIVSNV
ncbi:FAD-dependent oxidoreductase [Agaribacterium haliotis]|uniref:FAD-dependent oxidoreductase n=1 Tax=Agaribacterium haliotis TaxID=2013869 RepID=UPI000BB588F7|nr:FAD-dependent oxidoreductase [Agaribacterium haliotis]